MFEKLDRSSTSGPSGVMAKMEIGGSAYHHHGGTASSSTAMTSSSGYTVVPMKLYANWEVGTTSNAVQRVLTMIVNRLILPTSLKNDNTFSVAVRLQVSFRKKDIIYLLRYLKMHETCKLHVSLTCLAVFFG